MHGPQTPTLISVPVDARDGRLPNIDDLVTDYWIRPSIAQRSVIDLTLTRKYFDRYPISGTMLPFPCTLFFEDQGNRQGINRTLRQLGLAHNWKGNFIVVKNIHEEEFSDMSLVDEGVVIELVKQ